VSTTRGGWGFSLLLCVHWLSVMQRQGERCAGVGDFRSRQGRTVYSAEYVSDER
jgi:hypothetical protein